MTASPPRRIAGKITIGHLKLRGAAPAPAKQDMPPAARKPPPVPKATPVPERAPVPKPVNPARVLAKALASVAWAQTQLRAQRSHEVNVWLEATWPAAFAVRPRRPLARGTSAAVINHPDRPPSRKLIKTAVAYHCGRPDYLEALAADGSRRINLDGTDAGEVTEDERQDARQRMAARSEDE
jgi:ProQ/FINO family